MLQTTPKHCMKLHIIRIQIPIQSDVHNHESFITSRVLFRTYPSWGSKFTASAGLSQYVIRSLSFDSPWIAIRPFRQLSYNFTFPNIPSQFAVGFIPKFSMSSNCHWNKSSFFPIAFTAVPGRISFFS